MSPHVAVIRGVVGGISLEPRSQGGAGHSSQDVPVPKTEKLNKEPKNIRSQSHSLRREDLPLTGRASNGQLRSAPAYDRLQRVVPSRERGALFDQIIMSVGMFGADIRWRM